MEILAENPAQKKNTKVIHFSGTVASCLMLGPPGFNWFVCLFVLRLNIPVNNVPVMSRESQHFHCRELMDLAQGHNTVTRQEATAPAN